MTIGYILYRVAPKKLATAMQIVSKPANEASWSSEILVSKTYKNAVGLSIKYSTHDVVCEVINYCAWSYDVTWWTLNLIGRLKYHLLLIWLPFLGPPCTDHFVSDIGLHRLFKNTCQNIWNGFPQCFDTAGWITVMLRVKIVPELTGFVSGGTLNQTHFSEKKPFTILAHFV